jgi:hypothetical protein
VKEYLQSRPGEFDRVMSEDWVSDEWGDRRQELVFIGVNFDEGEIKKTLDACLLTDKELDLYRMEQKEFEASVLEENGASLFGNPGHLS